MLHRTQLLHSFSRPTFGLCMLGVASALIWWNAPTEAAGDKRRAKPPAVAWPLATPAPRSAVLTHDAWKNATLSPAHSEEIDSLVINELRTDNITPAAQTSDEQFIRRVTLDLTGQLPFPADVEEFISDKSSAKRAKLIDRLLDSEEYARHWARYWRDVIGARISDRRGLLLAPAFETWMTEQLKRNQSWDRIAHAMITPAGECRFADEGESGAGFLLGSRFGPDGINEQAGETCRVFLGIQIQCAQCHDHPSDQWKRVQFHELAAYFARVRVRPIRVKKAPLPGIELVALPRGELAMPSKTDPKKRYTVYPRFLDGWAPGVNLNDQQRRKALADAIVDEQNYWFSAAYVNRIWGELMGQSFYQPVDDMGPQKEAVFANVLTRMASSFRATHFDIKALFRLILNSQTYQRQIRLGESTDQHLHFAAAYPSRLRADALWDSLVHVLGSMGQPARPAANLPKKRGRPQGLEAVVKNEFQFDPSIKSDEVEGSIPQALVLMNNPLINQKIEARGKSLLGRILSFYPQDDDALRMVYLRTLARKPTDRERDKTISYIQRSKNRNEAFEDILWALINSTEFQSKR